MKKILSPLFFLLFLLGVNDTYAQISAWTNDASSLVYVFRLKPEHAFALVNAPNELADSAICSNPIDSFPRMSTYERQLETGYYLFVYADNLAVEQHLVCVSNLDIHVIGNGRDFEMEIRDKKTGRILTDAEINAGKQVIRFDRKTASYHARKLNKPYRMVIRAAGETIYFSGEKEKNGKRSGSKPDAACFVAFSKPKYLPGDTVKMKVHYQRKGHFFNKELELRLDREYNWSDDRNAPREVLRQTLKPVQPGVYTYQFVLGDSLLIDKNYEARLYRKKRKKTGYYIGTGNFRLEDYQLDDMRVNSYCSMEKYYARDSVILFINATDANNLPVPDGRVVVSITPAAIEHFEKNGTTIPFETLKKEQPLNPDGITRIAFPPKTFANAAVRYKAIVEVYNSNNELHRDSSNFSVVLEASEFRFDEKGDSVTAVFLENGLPKPSKGKTWTMLNGDTLLPQEVTFPYAFRRNPVAEAYVFSCNGSLDMLTQDDAKLVFKTRRTADSIFVSVSSEYMVVFHYEIYRGKKLISTADLLSFQFNDRDTTDETYRVQCSYYYGGKSHTEIRTLKPASQTLQVRLQGSEQVYPGQKADMAVVVTDYKGRPVSNADVTAVAVNAQFKEDPLDLPVDFNPQPGLKKKTLWKYSLSGESFHASRTPDLFWYKRLHLDTIHRYHYFVPGKEIYRKQVALDSIHDPQFSVLLSSQKGTTAINMLYLDEQLVYANLGSLGRKIKFAPDDSPFAFRAAPGMHRLRIRTKDAVYTLDSVEILPGHKLELSFDPTQLPGGVKKERAGVKLTAIEKQTLADHLLLVKSHYNINVYVKQGKNIRRCMSSSRYTLIDQPEQPFTAYSERYREVMQENLKMQAGKINMLISDSLHMSAISLKLKNLKKRNYDSYSPGQLALNDNALPVVKSVRAYTSTAIPLPSMPYRTSKDNACLMVMLHDDSLRKNMNHYVLQNTNGRVLRIYRMGERYSWSYEMENEAFFMHDLQPGDYTVTFFAKDGSFKTMALYAQAAQISCYELEKGGFSPAANMQLPSSGDGFTVKYSSKGGSIKGTVSMVSRTESATGFIVAVGTASYRSRSKTIDGKGNFEFDDLSPGVYNLFVGDKTHEGHTTIMGLIVSETVSPEVYVSMEDSAHVKNFLLAFAGKNQVIETNQQQQHPYPAVNFSPSRKDHIDLPGHYLYQPESYYSRVKEGIIRSKPDIDWNGYYIYFYSGFEPEWPDIFRRTSRFASRTYRQVFNIPPPKRKFRTISCPSFGGRYEQSSVTGWNYSGNTRGAFDYGVLGGELNEVQIITGGVPASLALTPGVISTDRYLLKAKRSEALFDKYEEPDGKLALDSIRTTDPAYNAVRSKFSDNAFWQPVLFTDDKGEVHFSVTYPDNLTGWRSYAVAFGENQSGGTRHFTRSFKPLAATLSCPRFLVEGDQSELVGKAINYTDKPEEVSTLFTIEDRPSQGKTLTVKDASVAHEAITAPSGSDSLKVEFQLSTKTGYLDGEKRFIPVFRKGVEEAKGRFWLLEGDTSFSVPVNAQADHIEVSAFGNELDVLLNKIQDIKAYEYECNEQLSSKLRALLMEKRICAATGKSFRGENDIRKILKRLDKNQHEDGSWGWWKNSAANPSMTLIVLEALLDAQKMDYVTSADDGIMYVYYNFGKWPIEQMVHGLYVLSRAGKRQVDFKTAVEELEDDNSLSTYAKYQLIRIRQMNKLEYVSKVNALVSQSKATVLGGAYWGEHSTEWYGNSTQLTLLAYHILQEDSARKKELKKIRNYFLEPNNTNAFRNTYESAEILDALLPAYLDEYKKGGLKNPTLSLSGAITSNPQQLPLIRKYKPASGTVEVKKTGASPLYLSIYERKWNSKPEAKDDLFAVKTSFVSQGETVDTLKAGQPVLLKVEVEAKKKGNYVMIEVPIPAGCSYDAASQPVPGVESHREQFKNKTSIFCESLPEGSYTFYIPLQPRYSGSYTLNAAKAEMMYFPIFFGRCGQKNTIIR